MAVIELPDEPGFGRGIHWVGPTDPGAVGAMEVWFDPTPPGVLKVRNQANTAWLTVNPPVVPVDPTLSFFAADLPAGVTGPTAPLVFTDFYDRLHNVLAAPPVASGLTFLAGTFTAAVDGIWAVAVGVQPLPVANEAAVKEAYQTPWFTQAIYVPPNTPTTAYLTFTDIVALKATETLQVNATATAAQKFAADVTAQFVKIS